MMRSVCLTSLPLLLALGLLLGLPWVFAITTGSGFYGLEVNRSAPRLETASGNLLEDDQRASNVFLGYRGCAAACPAQLMNMQRLRERLEGQGIRFVFVTLAPGRISGQELADWMDSWGPDFTAFRPESARRAQALARAFGGVSGNSRVSDQQAFNHTANLHVVTPDGIRRLVYSTPALDLDRVVQDLESIVGDFQDG